MRPLYFLRTFRRTLSLTLFGLLAFFLIHLTARAHEQPPAVDPRPVPRNATEALMRDLPWRPLGPAIMGGRIDDIAAVESDPRIVYVATAAGGLLKTVNQGTTWETVFDGYETSSIGDVAIAPSNPAIIYIGTGEANNRQSSSWGNGVYRSIDAGKTWQYLGLKETHHIGRVVIHPTNPDVAYVAAGGHLWGANPERGVYKTADGGKTWEKVLFVNEDTGCTDIALDPTNPEILFAALYQRRRTPFGFVGGGPGSGLYKSADGGKTWNKAGGGFPSGTLGRIGIDIYRKDPKTIYCSVETRNSGSTQNALSGSIYCSTDSGETWEKRSDTNPRPMYFSQIRVDPNNSDRVWLLGVTTYFSVNGGRTFRASAGNRVHADGHALWINPANSEDMILGTDGGVQWSWDGGRTWDYANNIPISQFYEVHFDYRQPYWVYGGLQDNGSWGAPSSLPSARGVTNDEWLNVGGGDGFYAQADPTDPNIVYSESQQGSVRRINIATGESKSIRPRTTPGGAYRFDWNSPLLISPHDPKKLLFAGNHLFISYDRGDTWRETPDLTTNPNRDRMPIMGAPVTRDTLSANDGQTSFGQIVTLTESPIKAGVLYVGTDDGNLQVSQDDGKTWKNIAGNIPGLPRGTYVSRVSASYYAPGRCYVSFDGHRSDDFKPYVYVTDDYGKTWQRITANLPEGGSVRVVREHPRTANLLFVGTERGVFVSFNGGGYWERFEAPFPATIPVADIQIHPRDNDLILATHARGIWILDDLGPFEALARASNPSILTLAPPKPAVTYRYANRKGITGDKIYIAPNPTPGALIQFYLPPGNTGVVKVTILSSDGKTVVRDVATPRLRNGWNRIGWDLRHNPPVPPAGGPGQGGAGLATGPRVLPGTYQVRVAAGATEVVQPLQVSDDPRITLTEKERKAIFDTGMRLSQRYAIADTTRRSLSLTRIELTNLLSKAPSDLKPRVEALIRRIVGLEARIALQPRQQPQPPPTPAPAGGEEAPERPVLPPNLPLTLRITRLMATLDSFTEPLSPATRADQAALDADIKQIVQEANLILGKEIPALNQDLQKVSLPAISVQPKISEQ